jgi:hypothetical protein
VNQAFESTHLALANLDESVEAIAIIHRGHLVSKLRNHLQTNPVNNGRDHDTFLVTNLLSGAWYVVSRFDSHTQLITAFKDQLILVDVDSKTDFTEVADHLANQLPI